MTRWQKKLQAPVAALLLGVALMFAFAPFEVFPLAILAPAGLLALLLSATPKRAFWLGYAFGVGLFSTGLYWIFISVHYMADIPSALAVLITAALAAFLALYPALTCYLLNRYFPVNNTAKLVCAFPAIWVLLEWVRSWLFTGFTWFFIGYSQTNSPLKGYAPILSVYGVSLAILLSAGFIVNAVIKYKQHQYKSTYLNIFTCLSIWILGALLCLIPWTQPIGKPLAVHLVQGNIPQTLKWSPDHLQLSFERYASLTEPLWGKDNIIIWPEAAIPMSLQDAADFINDMDSKALATKSHLITGIPVHNPGGRGYYNGIVTLGADKNTYLKRLLVPFGEYIPLQQLLARLLTFFDIPIFDTLAGNLGQKPLVIGSVKILASICFEITFPQLMRTTDNSVGLLLTLTNDAWFGKSTAQAQHLQMAKMRALELGRPVIFASNDGITAIIDSHGIVTAAAKPHEVSVLSTTVQPMTGITPWMQNSTNPILLILIVLLIRAIRTPIIKPTIQN